VPRITLAPLRLDTKGEMQEVKKNTTFEVVRAGRVSCSEMSKTGLKIFLREDTSETHSKIWCNWTTFLKQNKRILSIRSYGERDQTQTLWMAKYVKPNPQISKCRNIYVCSNNSYLSPPILPWPEIMRQSVNPQNSNASLSTVKNHGTFSKLGIGLAFFKKRP